jgi:cell division initiation protein
MGMTHADVEQKTFSTALRGYDLDEVDDFLDEVVGTIRELQDQIVEAKAEPPTATPAPAPDESAIGRALVTAQTTADTMIADAKSDAEQIRVDAQTEADSWADERDARKAEANEEMEELTRHVAGVRTQLAVLATAVADRLDEMDGTIGNNANIDMETDFSEGETAEDDQPEGKEWSSDEADDDGSPDEESDDRDSDDADDESDDEDVSSTDEDDTDA